MGEGFRIKVAKAYQHFIQKQLPKLESGLLFSQQEITETRYPCRFSEDDAPDMAVGEKVTLILRSERAIPAILRGVSVIGRIEGEAATIVRGLFKEANVWPGVMDVTVTAVNASFQSFEVSPL
jgi:hypothetical protein